jgi:hypothetical protein
MYLLTQKQYITHKCNISQHGPLAFIHLVQHCTSICTPSEKNVFNGAAESLRAQTDENLIQQDQVTFSKHSCWNISIVWEAMWAAVWGQALSRKTQYLLTRVLSIYSNHQHQLATQYFIEMCSLLSHPFLQCPPVNTRTVQV